MIEDNYTQRLRKFSWRQSIHLADGHGIFFRASMNVWFFSHENASILSQIFTRNMRVGAVLLAQASVVAFSLKVTNEGSRFLRVEPGSSTISCPVDLIPEGIPNTIVLNKPGVDGRNTLVYKCNRGSVASNASPSSDNPREFSVACKSGKDGSIVVAKTDVSCVPARCALDSLLGLRHATIDLPDTVKGSSVAIDSVVTIECKEGFSIDGVASGPRSRQLKCDQDQQLVTLYSPLEENDCKAVSCGQLTVPDNSFIASGEKPMQKLSYGDQVKFSCRDAYFFKPSLPSPGAVTGTSFSMFCDANGDFVTVGDAGACVPISCPIPPVFDGADLVAIHTDAVHVADQIAFVCHRGAHFINSTAEIVTPVSSKHWTASAQSLVPQRTRFEVNCLYDAEEKVGYYDTDPTIARCEPERCPPPLTDLPSKTDVFRGRFRGIRLRQRLSFQRSFRQCQLVNFSHMRRRQKVDRRRLLRSMQDRLLRHHREHSQGVSEAHSAVDRLDDPNPDQPGCPGRVRVRVCNHHLRGVVRYSVHLAGEVRSRL